MDQFLGTSRPAIYLRSAAALTIFAFHAFWVDGQKIDGAILRVLDLVLAWQVAPGLRDLNRVYGPRTIFNAVTALYIAIPLALVAFFVWAGFQADQDLPGRLGYEAIAVAFGYCTYQLILWRRSVAVQKRWLES